MLQIVDHIREYAALQNPEPTVRETYFAYNEQTGQWITSNEEVAPVLLLLQFVEANTIRDNTTFQIIAQWLYTTTVGDNAIRPFQQQALHELQKLTHYLSGDNDTLPLYEIAGARYTTIHTEQPYIAAGATVTWTLTAKDFFFKCCDELPVTPDELDCQTCPEFNLEQSIATAASLGPPYIAPNTIPTAGSLVVTYWDGDPAKASQVQTTSYVDSNGTTLGFGIVGDTPISASEFYLVHDVTADDTEGTIWIKFVDCDFVTIPVPSTP